VHVTKQVTSASFQAINLMIFVHRALVPEINDIQSAVVATGVPLGGTTQMGNKGAVGISFNCHDCSYLFLSCHFAANQDKVDKRNQDYRTIESEMQLRPSAASARQSNESQAWGASKVCSLSLSADRFVERVLTGSHCSIFCVRMGMIVLRQIARAMCANRLAS